MRIMMLGGAASMLGGGAYLAGAFESGEYYAMSPAAVEARLAGMQFGPELGNGGSDNLTLVLRSRGPKLVRWDLALEGTKLAEVRANLSSDDPGTRVSVEFQFTDGDKLMGLKDDPVVNDVAKIALAEKVDSTLDGRAFNGEVVEAKMAAMIAANPQSFANMQTTLHKNVAKEMDEFASDPSPGGNYSGSNEPSDSKDPSDFSKTHADGGWGNKGQ